MTPGVLASARLDHVAVAVPDRARAERTYVDAMGAGRVALARNGGIEIEQLRFGNGCKLELLSPYGDRAAARRLSEHLEQRPASIHHITLLVASLDNAVGALASANVRCVGLAEQPDGSREAFVLPGDAGGLLVQLVQKDIDDVEWARRHGQVVDDPTPGAAHFVGALYAHADLHLAARQMTTLGATVTIAPSLVKAQWADSQLCLWLAPTPAATELIIDGTPPRAPNPHHGPAVTSSAGLS